MTIFQLLLLLVTGGIFYLFFKQLFSENYPKRGTDFEAKTEDEQIGGISRPDKIFSTPAVRATRMEQLFTMADEAIEKEDFDEAHKAFGAALIVEEHNVDALQKMAYVCITLDKLEEAKACYDTLITIDSNDDMAHALLANLLHKMGEDQSAIKEHELSISLDADYAPHYFNYANTLHDLNRPEEALVQYQKAYSLDDTLSVAKEMIDMLSKENG